MNAEKTAKLPEVGLVYREIAWAVAEYEGYSIYEAADWIESGDLRQIEQHVRIAAIVQAASHKVCKMLLKDVEVSENFFWTMMFSETPSEDLRTMIAGTKQLEHKKRANAINAMMKAAHNEWVRVHAQEFFDPEKQNDRCLYMPYELIGYSLAESYWRYIGPIADVLGWTKDRSASAMNAIYLLNQKKYMVGKGIYSTRDLVDFISRCEYKALSLEIMNAIREDRRLAEFMAIS